MKAAKIEVQRQALAFSEIKSRAADVDGLKADAVFDRMKSILGCRSDSEMATVLGQSPQQICDKRRRGSVPYEDAVALAWAGIASLSWLLTGRR